MNENLKNILSNLSTDIDQETLLKYLQGKLSEEQKNEVEKAMLAGEFEEDALEGLEKIKNKGDIEILVEQLNYDLKKKLEKKKKWKKNLRFKDQPWIYVAVILILFLIVISYFIIHRMLQHS